MGVMVAPGRLTWLRITGGRGEGKERVDGLNHYTYKQRNPDTAELWASTCTNVLLLGHVSKIVSNCSVY